MKGVFRKNIVHFKEVESTNLLALSMIKENTTPLPFVITTDFQTLGKGQLSNKWESENGKNLLISIAINTDIKIENQFILNVIPSLSVLDLLEDLNLENLSVKWPNDIYVGSKKIGGILIENNVRETRLVSSIVGVGININQTSFSKELNNPVSYQLLTGLEIDLEEALEAVLTTLNIRYQQLRTNKIEEINSDYLRALYQFGNFANYRVNNKRVACKIVDVNKNFPSLSIFIV